MLRAWATMGKTAGGIADRLPPRKLNLTEWQSFANAMAEHMRGSYRIAVVDPGPGPYPEKQWDDLPGMLPDERARLQIAARGPAPDGLPEDSTSLPHVAIALSSRPRLDIVAPAGDVERIWEDLYRRWMNMGRPVPRSWLIYPTVLLLALGVALAGSVVLWIRGDMSLWLIPLVLLSLATGFQVFSPVVQRRVERELRRDGPLPIDFRLHEKVQEARATTWARWRDRLEGAVFTALLGGIGILINWLQK